MSQSAYWDRALRRRVSRRRLLRGGTMAVGVTTLALAGCTGGGATAPTAPAASGTSPAVISGATPVVTIATQNIKRGGQAATCAIATIPHFEGGGPARLFQIPELLGGNWNQLVRYRAQSFMDNVVVPDLADSWEVSDGGKTYTFKLNPKAKWHNTPPVNGRDFTSDDVKWNWQYYTNPQVRSFLAPLYEGIVDVQTPDKKTVVFRLEKPTANFLDRMASGYNKMLAREVFEQDGNFQKTLVGTGPFMLDKFEQNVSVTMKRNPDYWKTGADGKPLPYLDGYIGYMFTSTEQTRSQLLAGNLSWSAPGGADRQDLDQLRQRGLRIVDVDPPTAAFIRFNLSKPPFDKLEARKAATYMVDQNEVLKNWYSLPDGKLDGHVLGYIPTGFGDWVLPESEIKAKLKYDLAEAKRLAQSSGLAGQKFQISSYLRLTGYYTDAPQYLQQQFKEIGVDVEPNWFPDTTAFTRAQTGGDFNMLLAPEGYNGDIDNWVYNIWHSKSPTNFAKLNDPKVDQFAENQRYETDPNKRKQIILDFQRYMLDQFYWVPMGVQVQHDAYQPYVRNFSRHWSFGLPGLELCWFDK